MSEVDAFLSDGAAYGTPGAPVERIETHAAIVFLAGERAFKIKRPVRYSFLDFTSLAQREATLRHEFELNRRTAPELYRRVVPIVRASDGVLRLGGEGEPVEWALEMARFPDEARLDRVAERGELDAALAEALGREVFRFHADLEPLTDAGGAAAMREVAAGNAEDLRRLVPETFAREAVERLLAATDARLEAASALLDRRRAEGFVRFCHGDLHLENLVLQGGRPVPFDCVEFNDAFAKIDVWYDLAYLLMDLLWRDLPLAAHRCFQAYLDAGGDLVGVGLLPLFLAVRATVRAKVEGFAANLAEAAEDSARLRTLARSYLDLAARLLDPPGPRLVAVGGLSGTGKTTLARLLAPDIGSPPGAVILRSDLVRKELMGVAPTERLPEAAYRSRVGAQVYAELHARAADLLRAGHCVIVDAVSGAPKQKAALAEVARAAGVPFTGLWLEAPLAELKQRVDRRTGDASDADSAVVRRQARGHLGAGGWRTVDARGAPEEVVARARAALQQPSDRSA
jgi:aminoglycoside phosphotransferase family enzyme/predicted kinase